MFRPGRRRHYGRGGGGGFGLLLLGMQLFSFFNFLSRSDRFFPVTIGVMGLNVVAYFRPRGMRIHWPSIREACISVQGVWFQGQWKRLFTSPFVHAGDYHLYYNMASFMWKAVTLERHFGSAYFAYMVAVFSVATGLLYLALHYAMAELLDQWSAMQSCAVGFSAVIFALKVVTTHIQPAGMTLVMGFFPIPTRLACWAELVIISVLFPNVSFVGHLAGILVGLAYVWGPLKMVMDMPVSMLDTANGFAPPVRHAGNSYTYRAAPTGFRGRGVAERTEEEDDEREEEEDDEREEEEERELQEAIRSSLRHHHRSERTPVPSAPPPSHHPPIDQHSDRRNSVDRDLQIAIERSVRDRGDDTAPETAPPPLNPSYHQPSNVPGNSGDSEDTSTVRRRHVERREEVDMDAVRAARLRRFETSA